MSEKRKRGPKPGTGSKYDLDLVATIALQAFGNRAMSLAVADHYRIDRRIATAVISRARKSGHTIPFDTQHSWAGAPFSVNPRAFTPPVVSASTATVELVCGCGWTCDLDRGVVRLFDHVWREHGRVPTDRERTPVSRQGSSCAVDGCVHPVVAKGVCNRHYQRARRVAA